MSAIISHCAFGAVVILTDGAIYRPDGTLYRVGRKIDVSAEVPMAVATRGDMHVGDLLTRHVMRIIERDGFDEGMATITASFPQWREKLAELRGRYSEVLIAGVSEMEGPRHRFFHTGRSADFPAFEMIDPGQAHVALNGVSSLSLADMGLRRPYPWETPVDYFSTIGVDIMEYCRRVKIASYNNAYLVGGQVDMTIVRPAGVTVETIHRWNDKIGDLIDPSKDRPAAKVVPIAAAGLSRQQRRAAERLARKGLAA